MGIHLPGDQMGLAELSTLSADGYALPAGWSLTDVVDTLAGCPMAESAAVASAFISLTILIGDAPLISGKLKFGVGITHSP